MARGKSGLPINVLISALVVIALVPSAILFIQLWQDMMRPHSVTLPVTPLPIAAAPRPAGLDYPKDGSRFQAEDNDAEDTPLSAAVDASDGAPGSAGEWSLASDETGALPLSPPAQDDAVDVTANTDGRDDPVLASPEMPPSTAPSPAATVQPQALGGVGLPQRKPITAAGAKPVVRTVKVVTITAPPLPSRPHDGAYALGSPSDDAPAEWMETKTAVDMHAKAEQSSETVKVAEGGVKMRVTARDKNWVQVTDPATSATGWIYNVFLKPAEAPAQ